MQRKTRILLRAAKYLEQEAAEYIAWGKEDSDESHHCGRRAMVMLGIAHCVRAIALTGYSPSKKDQDSAARSIHDTIKGLHK